MIFTDGALALLCLGFWLFCIIDVITTDESSCRNLPKLVWLLVVFIGVEIGGIIWLIAGRPQTRAITARSSQSSSAFPEYDRLGRAEGTTAEADEAFLRQCRERAQAQRDAYRKPDPQQ